MIKKINIPEKERALFSRVEGLLAHMEPERIEVCMN
jgi:hypothetical protein